MHLAPAPAIPAPPPHSSPDNRAARVLVACPDARPPAYEAVLGLSRHGWLDEFATSFYYRDQGAFASAARSLAPSWFARQEPRLLRRHVDGLAGDQVRPHPAVDVALAIENRLGRRAAGLRRGVARWRTRRFDAQLARRILARRPTAALIFSDVGSEFALPSCRQVGCSPVLSMVHGEVGEELEVLDAEAGRSPEFLPIYLADGPIDRRELAWLHDRRLRDLELADVVLVPSRHIADRLVARGTPRAKLRVVPYAADTARFVPDPARPRPTGQCTFLFAGGITQRKGIKYLLEAWRRVRRPGWTLQLLGGLPADPRPLEPYRDEVRWLGRVGHREVPAAMAAADVFVFPSLFEGSAVVTYEALASGLPSIVTPSAGAVVRDGIEGFEVAPGAVEPLADAMERLGRDVELRAEMSLAARRRGEEYDWARYRRSILEVLAEEPGRSPRVVLATGSR